MEDYWCLFVVVAMLIYFFFPSKGWDFSFCLFTSHDVGAFACIVFSVGLSDLIHKSRVWLLYCFSCFFYDEYVRASMHVFWYILWIFSVWMSMKALPCIPLWPCINELYFSRKSFVSDYPFTSSSLELNPSSYFWWNTAHSCLSASFQSVYCVQT